MPPAELYEDDSQAAEMFQKNKGKFRQPRSSRSASARHAQGSSTAEVDVKGKEEKGKEVEVNGERTVTTAARQESSDGNAAQQENRADGAASPLGKKSIEQLADERGLVPRPGETIEDFRRRVVLRVLDETARERKSK